MEPRFGIENATVDVAIRFNMSSQENYYGGLLVPYVNITSPSQVKMQTQGIQLTIPYNVQINVSITISLCGQYRVLTIFPLLYSKWRQDDNYYSRMIVIIIIITYPLD